MKRRIVSVLSCAFIIISSGLSQAAELELYPQNVNGGFLSDGTRISMGRILCQHSHSRFHIWMSTQNVGEHAAQYVIKGLLDSQHMIRVRLSGEGWSPSLTEEQRGMVKFGTDEMATFNVLIDGSQNVEPDKYTFTLHGACL
ncbi:TPA: adhesin [Escherichia coli]|nr:adhesin [Escherichia coli]